MSRFVLTVRVWHKYIVCVHIECTRWAEDIVVGLTHKARVVFLYSRDMFLDASERESDREKERSQKKTSGQMSTEPNKKCINIFRVYFCPLFSSISIWLTEPINTHSVAQQSHRLRSYRWLGMPWCTFSFAYAIWMCLQSHRKAHTRCMCAQQIEAKRRRSKETKIKLAFLESVERVYRLEYLKQKKKIRIRLSEQRAAHTHTHTTYAPQHIRMKIEHFVSIHISIWRRRFLYNILCIAQRLD